MEVIHPAGERAFAIGAPEMIDDRNLAVLAADNERMRKDGAVFPVNPVKDLHRKRDLHVPGNVEQRAGTETRLVQRCIFVGAQLDRLHHEKLAKELFVLAGGHFKRLDQHAVRQSLDVLVKQGVIAEDQLGQKSLPRLCENPVATDESSLTR